MNLLKIILEEGEYLGYNSYFILRCMYTIIGVLSLCFDMGGAIMMNMMVQLIFFIVILLVLARPLGRYISKVAQGEKVFCSKILRPIERFCYRLIGTEEDKEMSAKKYIGAALMFGVISVMTIFVLLKLQHILPLNPEGLPSVSSDLAFNTALSFATNTNWQAYSGETTLSYLTQMLGLTVQNFLSAAAGIAVLFALIRGFTRAKSEGIGNFWVDMVRSTLYILIPLSILVSVILISQGTVQNFKPYQEAKLIEKVVLEDGREVESTLIPMGPAASQIAIKQLGTNGGGFFGTNSAYPLENPTPLSNMAQVLCIFLIPAALCFAFGDMVKDRKQGRVLLLAMLLVFIVCLIGVVGLEQAGTPQLMQHGAVDSALGSNHPGGNMEGKEMRFGITGSGLWGVVTTAASNGSVNSMHDSYTPLAGGILMFLMQLGEVIFGGVGSGLYGMLAFAILAVFIAGLMVGRTPEYLGKKIEPFEMKMASLVILTPPIVVLIGTALATLFPGITQLLSNTGAHGFSEILYAYSSAGNNNGSAFAGFGANNPFVNFTTGIAMLIARFVPMVVTIKIAGSLAAKKKVPVTAGTLATHNGLFVGLLIAVIIIVGALSFFPALALGPIAEYLEMLFI